MWRKKCTICGMKSRDSTRCSYCGVRFKLPDPEDKLDSKHMFQHCKIENLSANYIDVQNIQASVIKAGCSINEAIHAAMTLNKYGVK